MAVAVSTTNNPAPAPPRPVRSSPSSSRTGAGRRRGRGRSGSTSGSAWPSSWCASCCTCSSGLKFGEIVVLRLPEVTLPSWAAGIQLGGTVYLEGLLGGGPRSGLRLAVMIACIGAANALANPKRLLRALPGALHEIGSAVVVSVSVAPQLAESVQRVRRARQLRGDTTRGIRAVPTVALPVLEDTLERSLLLAAAMDSRGYGRAGARAPGPPAAHRRGDPRTGFSRAPSASTACSTRRRPAVMGTPTLLAGLALSALGLWLGGRHVAAEHLPARPVARRGVADPRVRCASPPPRSSPSPAPPPSCSRCRSPPSRVPPLPLAAVVGLLVGALPAYLTPAASAAGRRGPAQRGAREEVGARG